MAHFDRLLKRFLGIGGVREFHIRDTDLSVRFVVIGILLNRFFAVRPKGQSLIILTSKSNLHGTNALIADPREQDRFLRRGLPVFLCHYGLCIRFYDVLTESQSSTE